MTQSNNGSGPDQTGGRPGQPTGEMTLPERKDKPPVAPTVVDDGPALPAEGAPPWAAPGKTQPGEPPPMSAMAPPGDVPYVAAPGPEPPAGGGVPYVAAPPPGGGVSYVAAPGPSPYGPSPQPMGYPPPMMPPRPRRRSGAGLLVVASLLGLLVTSGAVVGVVAMRSGSSDDPAPTIDVSASPQTEVKPEVPDAGTATATSQPTPAPAPATPAPAEKPVVHATPRPTTTATTPPAKPTATTQVAAKPTTSATAAPHPSATSTGSKIILRRPTFRFPRISKPANSGSSKGSTSKGNLPVFRPGLQPRR